MSDSITIQNNNIMPLVDDLRQIINQARNRVAVNAELTLMYWHIGERINREVLGNERAEYGKQIVSAVSTQLQSEFGKKGFEPRSIWRMMQFAQEFPEFEIVSTVSAQFVQVPLAQVQEIPILQARLAKKRSQIWSENLIAVVSLMDLVSQSNRA